MNKDQEQVKSVKVVPSNILEVLDDIHVEKWKEAIKAELQSLTDTQTFEKVKPSSSHSEYPTISICIRSKARWPLQG